MTGLVVVAFLIFIAAYVCGSIPFGLVLTRLAGTQDLRVVGSGNIGATNVLRTGRRDLAAATLLLDAAKGFAAVAVAGLWGADLALVAALGAFLGHIFPVWLSFRGGKGAATYLGCLAAYYWPAALVFAVVWLGVAVVTRYSSAASLAASAAAPLAFVRPELNRFTTNGALVFTAMAALLWFMHRANIARLRAGTEGKIGKSA